MGDAENEVNYCSYPLIKANRQSKVLNSGSNASRLP